MDGLDAGIVIAEAVASMAEQPDLVIHLFPGNRSAGTRVWSAYDDGPHVNRARSFAAASL